ncbi:MAG TPA: hypothetical protein ENM98_02130, partial [Halothiobacillaceae bacterium]|nr:hypothetical protein [Halothiobacillaceae bacterium]
AILVRSRDEAELIRNALNQRSVPCVFLSEKASVFQSEQAVDLSRWLAAMHQPERADLIRLALSTRSTGLSRAQLIHYLEHEPAFDQISQLFVQLKQIWAEQGVLAAILKLVHFFGLGAQENAEVSRSDARILTNIMHLADWLNQKSEQIEGRAALIQRLEQAREHDPGEQELRLEQDANLVRIITIHKAKGLQFPVVYLPFIAATGLSNHKNELLVQTVNGQKQIQFNPNDADLEQQKAEEQAEDMRLLYVGLTRAEYNMTIGLGPVISGRGKAWNMQKGPVGRLLGLDSDPKQAEKSFKEALNKLGQHTDIKVIALQDTPESPSRFTPQKEQITPTVRTALPRDFKPWWISSFSALTGHNHQNITAPEDARAEREAEPDPDLAQPPLSTAPLTKQHEKVQNLPKGAAMGTLLHDLIERALLLQQENQHPRTLEQWQDWVSQARHLLKPSQKDLQNTLAIWLNDLFLMPIKTPDGAVLSLNKLTLFQTEMEFWFACNTTHTREIDGLLQQHIHPAQARPPLANHQLNGMIKGFIDLVFEFEGRYYLIDWKSNYLGANTEHYYPEQLSQAVLKARYDLQYSLYTLALHRHLADRIINYDYDQHFGGVIYIFLRGIYAHTHDNPSHTPGVYVQRPPWDLINALDRGFADQPVTVT